jgi:hypothetical protein
MKRRPEFGGVAEPQGANLNPPFGADRNTKTICSERRALDPLEIRDAHHHLQ